MLYTQISLSLRVLLCHYRRCAANASSWATCQRRYKGEEDLGPIGELLGQIEFEEEDAVEPELNVDWNSLAVVTPEFWEASS